MHTVHGHPGFYNGEQIVYGNIVKNLCNSLSELRRQQQSTIRWRKSRGFDAKLSDYGYVRLYDDAFVSGDEQ